MSHDLELGNADFSSPAADDTIAIDNDDNPVPAWRYEQSVGAATISAFTTPDTAYTSGYKLTFDVSGASGTDTAYMEAMVGVAPGTRAEHGPYIPVHDGGADYAVEAVAQYVQADQTTTTGTAATEISPIVALANTDGLIPDDAAYLRVRVQVRRVGAGATTAINIPYVGFHNGVSEPDGAFWMPTGSTNSGWVEGTMVWGTDVRGVVVNDGVTPARAITPVGWTAYAYPVGGGPDLVSAATESLAAVAATLGGTAVIPFYIPAAGYLQNVRLWATDTVATIRTAEYRIFVDRRNASNNGNLITGTDGTFSFTPAGAAAGRNGSLASAPIFLPPGIVWLAIRNTSTAVTFGIGVANAGTLTGANVFGIQAVAALGTTLDLITGWTKRTTIPLVRLQFRVAADTVAY